MTFIPDGENNDEKYTRYFNMFELYPEDLPAFYTGAGFSLAFTKHPIRLEEFLRSYERVFQREMLDGVRKGVREAVELKHRLLPKAYLPALISLKQTTIREDKKEILSSGLV